MNQKTSKAIGVGGVTLAAILLVFDRLLLHLSTNLPGDPTAGARALLALWWPTFSLRVADTMAIHSYLGAPSLSNHTLALPIVPSVLFWALRTFSGPVLAANLTMIVSAGLTAALTTLYLSSKDIPISAAALGGAALVLSPWYVRAVTAGDVIAASLWVLPVAFWTLDRWLENPTRLNGGLMVAAAYGGVLVGVPLGLLLLTTWLPYAAWRIWSARREDRGSARQDQLTVLALVLLGLLMLYPAPPLVRTLVGDEPAYGPLWQAGDRSLLGWALDTSIPILGAALITLLTARQQRRHIIWLLVGGVSLLIGVTALPDPITMILGALQAPAPPMAPPHLFLGGAAFTLLIYVGETLRDQPIQPRLRWNGVTAAVGVLIVLAADPGTYRGLAQHVLDIPGFYATIASEPEDYIVLDYPLGLSGSLDGQTVGEAAYLARNAVWHEKRSASGIFPALSADLIDDLERDSFLQPETLSASDLPEAAQAAADAVRRWRIGYVVVHPDLLDGEDLDQIEALLAASEALCPPVERDGLRIYRAQWNPEGCEE